MVVGSHWKIFQQSNKHPVASMYGIFIFAYIYHILPLKTSKCRVNLPYMDGMGMSSQVFFVKKSCRFCKVKGMFVQVDLRSNSHETSGHP